MRSANAKGDLEQFLQQEGLPFVYFGHVCSAELQGACLDVVEKLQCRGIFGFVASPHTVYDPRYMELYCQGRLYTVQGRPPQHTWLFPLCHAAVHHAGAGTTQAALSGGVPSVTLPHWGDQFYWASILHQLSAGTAPVPLASLTRSGASCCDGKVANRNIGEWHGATENAPERWTNPKRSRRTCTCEYGLQSCREKSAGVA
jgi:hypothetical protein